MFKGLGQLGDLAGMMKKAQEMQSKMGEAQAEIEQMVSEGEAGAGLVRVVVTGKGKLTSITIDPTILRADSKEIVEDLLIAAVNDGLDRAAERAARRMAEITEGLPIPDQFKKML